MLKVFRHKGVAKKVLWVIAVIIIISFGFGFGMSRYTNTDQQDTTVGKVFGQSISVKEFQSYALAVRDQAILSSGPNYEKLLPYLDLDNETWNRILLVKEANRRGLKTSDQDVITYIGTLPTFKRNGVFDKELYNTILPHVFRRSARDFEEGVRDQLRIMKLFQPALQKISLSDEKVRFEYERRNRKVQVGYALIDPATFSQDIAIDDKDLQTYFDDHRGDFLIPDSIKVQSVTIALDKKSSAEDHAQAQTTAQEIYQKCQPAGDLAAAAQEKDLKIRETGFFNMEEPDMSLGWTFDLWQQAFAADTGTVLAPVATSEGIVIAKIAERKAAYIPAFADAKTAVKNKLLADKAMTLAKDKATALRNDLVAPVADKQDPSAIITKAGLMPKETPFFSLGEYLPEIGISEDFTSAALNLNDADRLSEIVLTAKGPAILWWKAAQPIDEKKFAEAQKDFRRNLFQEESAQAANAIIEAIREQAHMENYLDRFKK